MRAANYFHGMQMTRESEEEGAVLDVVVVGGGPAGLTAATYLRRFNRSCVVLDSGDSRARWIPESNNCPGFPQGVSGVELLRRMKEQAASFDTQFESALVDSILPHEQGRMAWALKQKNPQLLYDEMTTMADKMRAKAQAVRG
jgi:2-polyprenyl-6-methoxyphenol hydroxylase-like FAD-dependent oxidoreductase